MLSYNVIIVGSDKYYAQGLKLLIDKIFIEGGFIGNVSFDKSKLNYADVVFKEVEGDGDCAMSLPLISKGFCGVVFPVFRDVRDVKRRQERSWVVNMFCFQFWIEILKAGLYIRNCR